MIKDEIEKLRKGVCLGCRKVFWWTGIIKSVPPCTACGRKHTKEDFSGIVTG